MTAIQQWWRSHPGAYTVPVPQAYPGLIWYEDFLNGYTGYDEFDGQAFADWEAYTFIRPSGYSIAGSTLVFPTGLTPTDGSHPNPVGSTLQRSHNPAPHFEWTRASVKFRIPTITSNSCPGFNSANLAVFPKSSGASAIPFISVATVPRTMSTVLTAGVNYQVEVYIHVGVTNGSAICLFNADTETLVETVTFTVASAITLPSASWTSLGSTTICGAVFGRVAFWDNPETIGTNVTF